MLHKMRDSRGLTMVEMLCAAAILILLALMVNTGLHMAMDSYRRMVLHSEANLLVSTLSDVLTDELRYASNVTALSPTTIKYSSRLYLDDTTLTVGNGNDSASAADGLGKNKGQIYAKTTKGASADWKLYPVLTDASYGGDTWSYGVPDGGLKITIGSDNIFKVELKVQEKQPDGTFSGITAEKTFSVRCLNPISVSSPPP